MLMTKNGKVLSPEPVLLEGRNPVLIFFRYPGWNIVGFEHEFAGWMAICHCISLVRQGPRDPDFTDGNPV